MKNIRFCGLLVTILLMVSHASKAFDDIQTPIWKAQFAPESPTAAAMAQYSDERSSLYGGEISLNIPVYTWQDGMFTIPISLAYHSSGFRPGQACGPVGMGWMLDAGGVITREVRGLPDESMRTGFEFKWANQPSHNASFLIGMGALSADAQQWYLYLQSRANSLLNERTVDGYASLYDMPASSIIEDTCEFVYSGTIGEEYRYCYCYDEEVTAVHGDYAETEPDVFHVSLPGVSASFILQQNHGVKFLSCKGAGAGELSIVFEHDRQAASGQGSRWILTDGHNVRYYFDVLEYSLSVCSNGALSSDDSGTISAWRLSRIEDPSGHDVLFNYAPDRIDRINRSAAIVVDHQQFGNGIGLSGKTWLQDGYTEACPFYRDYSNINQEARLTDIIIAGRGRIDFDWSGNTVSAIRVYNSDGAQIKTCRMGYFHPSYSGASVFLTSLSLSGLGTYHFDYIAKNSIPADYHFTDNYGYAGGRDLRSIINRIGERNDLEQLADDIIAGRTFNDTATKYGMLSRVTYPTGGYSDYSYERNTYRRDINGRQWNAAQPTGGMRVSKINTYDIDGTVIRSTTYDYGSGVLLGWPQIYYNYHYDDGDFGQISVTREGLSTLSGIGFGRSSHIEYPCVTQYVRDSDGGSLVSQAVFEYASAAVLSLNAVGGAVEKMESISEADEVGVLVSEESWEIHFSGTAGVANDAQFHGSVPMAGKLLTRTEEVITSGDPQVVEQTTYDQYGSAARFSAPCVKIGLGPLCERSYASHLLYGRVQTSAITNAGGSSFTSGTTREVNSDGQTIRVAMEDSDGLELEELYEYHPVVKGLVTRIESYRDGIPVSRRDYSYTCHNDAGDWYLPYRLKDYGISHSGHIDGTRTSIEFSAFDSWGNPTRFSDYKGIVHTLGWCDGGLHPVSERVDAADGLYQTRYWSWIPMVGPVSETDFTGRTLSYDYDGEYRLTAIHNDEGCISSYGYSIVSEDGGSINCISSTTFITAIHGNTDYVYYDGLGRQVQTVGYNTTDSSSMVSALELDALGRTVRTWIPFGTRGSTGYHSGFASLSSGCTSVAYENGRNGRPVSETLPGAAFASHPKLYGYQGNMVYQIETVTDPDGVTKTVTKDREDRVITENTGGNVTRYDYDHKGNLIRVTQPEGTAFEYVYDQWNRLVSKTIPGGGTTTYSYDSADRIEFSQDGNQRQDGKRIQYIYDSLGRVIRKRIVGATSTTGDILEEHYYNMDDNGGDSPLIPARLNFAAEAGVADTPASSSNMLVRSKMAIFPGVEFSLEHEHLDPLFPVNPLLDSNSEIAEEIARAETFDYLQKAYYYDQVGRIAQVVEDNILGGISRTSYKYDLAGNVLKTVERHTRQGVTGEDVKITERTYDGRGNMISESVTLNGVSAEVENTYNSINQLVCSHCGDSDYGLDINRSYNPLGWLTGIWACDHGGDDIFSESLAYESPSFGTPCYSGNISQVSWQQHGGSPMSFALTYDSCGRFVESRPQTGNAFSEQGITYDGNGNILSIDRFGETTDTTTRRFTYSYSGNRLLSIRDITARRDMEGHITPVRVLHSYNHDANGNMTVDGMQGLTIGYNLLNLPSKVTKTGMTATYRYSADGVKLEAKVSSGTSNVPAGQPTAYAYLGSLVYSKVGGSYQLESTDFSSGRIVPGDTQYTVRYHITDHLGSVRDVVWPEENSEGAVILEQNDYYPYGLRMDNGLTASTDNRYRFSGKEAQPLMGGSILDFGARYYNPTIARWTTIDPKAEKYYSTTPYSYCNNSPVVYVDPDGEVALKNVKSDIIVISARIYTNKRSYDSANYAANYWNNRKHDTFNGKNIVYNIVIILDDYSSLTTNYEDSSKRPQGNSYDVNQKVVDAYNSTKDTNMQSAGFTRDRKNVYISNAYALTKPGTDIPSTTGIHEIGHILGMSDTDGLMSTYHDLRTDELSPYSINEMISNASHENFVSWLRGVIDTLFGGH